MGEFIVDRLNLVVQKVSLDDFNRIKAWAEYSEGLFIDWQEYRIGKGVSQYHHNLRVNKGEGGIYIGYKHNKSKDREFFDMKIECNPTKVMSGRTSKYAWETISFILRGYLWAVRAMDLAIDIPVNVNSIFVVPMTGKMSSRVDTTKYFGSREGNMRLKVYDKKKERKKAGVEVPYDDLTRIEFSKVWDKPVLVDSLLTERVTIEDYYKITMPGDMKNIKGELRACILAIMSGDMQLKDFGRAMRDKIKKSQIGFDTLASDKLIQDEWLDICFYVSTFITAYHSNMTSNV